MMAVQQPMPGQPRQFPGTAEGDLELTAATSEKTKMNHKTKAKAHRKGKDATTDIEED